MASLGNKNKDDSSTRRAGGWRPRSLAARYDVVIVGDGALAAAVAWALTRSQPERRVAVLAPALMGQHWDPSCVARLHALRPDARVRSLLPRATQRYRAWAEELGLEPPRVDGGHLVLATTVQARTRLGAAAGELASCREVGAGERGEILDGHEVVRCLAGWYEPLASTMALPDLVFRLAEAAVAAGVHLVDGAAVRNVLHTATGYRLGTNAGVTHADVLVDLDPALALSRAAGLHAARPVPLAQQLTTAAMAPLLGVSVTIEEVVVSQRPSGEIDLVMALPGGLGPSGLEAAAAGASTVVRALPRLGGATIVRRRSQYGTVSPDGLAMIGQLSEGFWTAGGLGRHDLDLLPVVAEGLAQAIIVGELDASLADFSPQRLAPVGFTAPAALSGWNCATCGRRDRREFSLVAGRVVHTLGCGRPLEEGPLVDAHRQARSTMPPLPVLPSLPVITLALPVITLALPVITLAEPAASSPSSSRSGAVSVGASGEPIIDLTGSAAPSSAVPAPGSPTPVATTRVRPPPVPERMPVPGRDGEAAGGDAAGSPSSQPASTQAWRDPQPSWPEPAAVPFSFGNAPAHRSRPVVSASGRVPSSDRGPTPPTPAARPNPVRTAPVQPDLTAPDPAMPDRRMPEGARPDVTEPELARPASAGPGQLPDEQMVSPRSSRP